MIQSVDRAIQLMLALQGTRRLGVTELAERLGLAKGTVHGLLRTLTARAVVEQDPETGKYMLGPALLRLGNVYLENQELRSRSLRWTDALAQRTESAVRVGVLVVPDVLVVHHAFRPEGGTQFLEVGIGIPAHASCMGKAILAFRPNDLDRLFDEPLRRLTGTTEVEPAALRNELAEVRNHGYRLRAGRGGTGGMGRGRHHLRRIWARHRGGGGRSGWQSGTRRPRRGDHRGGSRHRPGDLA